MFPRALQQGAAILAFGVALSTAQAQKDTTKAPVYGWTHSMVGNLTATQVAFTDWVQGGENALAFAVGLDGKSVNDQPRTNWSNSYKFAFGETRLGDQGLRKTDDRIDLETMLTYKLNDKLNPYGAANLKTQFARGYTYDAVGNSTPVSQFFDPAFLTQSAGVVYQPIPEFKTRFGAGVREIVTSVFIRYADDPATAAIEKVQVRGGLESVTELIWKMEENIVLSSKLELFSAFTKMDQVIVRSDNAIVAKVTKVVTVMLGVQLQNEAAVSPRTQIKETLAFGLSYTFL